MTAETTPHAPITTAEKLAELRERLELAKEPGGAKAAAKRDKKGIPSARARIHEDPDPVQDSWWNNMLTRARIPAGPPPAQPRKPADPGTPTS